MFLITILVCLIFCTHLFEEYAGASLLLSERHFQSSLVYCACFYWVSRNCERLFNISSGQTKTCRYRGHCRPSGVTPQNWMIHFKKKTIGNYILFMVSWLTNKILIYHVMFFMIVSLCCDIALLQEPSGSPAWHWQVKPQQCCQITSELLIAQPDL